MSNRAASVRQKGERVCVCVYVRVLCRRRACFLVIYISDRRFPAANGVYPSDGKLVSAEEGLHI